ncbi:chemotaxis protein CheB [Legionella taurinensis]|uniref:protein-glutamate methylesterase n=1 Tax=Legionella taurinensis TaxID=70611 RepID=A0A3A5LEZ8_9GAMM|nr:chemotaxis protein CheB [Legionella taurinensis]MDX1838366.1 chemotaxis protein CheB [Legionella taurinensis]PUT39128.1 chemotaxis protein CheB [Legionella taurinensis]PUT39753.1 chemotaxis protein CheB [Legionella taurinensis]PUT43584.1 chemotaxis protein CheB [Legionella taurinensis]PUT45240.1 chemotaxis protein CheB [Legionella taurinensis]
MENAIVVIGTSAGGLNALKNLLSELPAEFPAPILIVKHISSTVENMLPSLLGRICKLPVIEARNNQPIQPGHIYIAPPKFHMVIDDGHIATQEGPKVNHSRPAIDPLFYSAALHYKEKTIGILLSGMLDDGSAGLLAIKKCGGITLVQDLKEAEYPDMPKNALKNVPIDYCLNVREMAALLIELVTKKIKNNSAPSSDIQMLELEFAMNYMPAHRVNMDEIATPSVFTCPDCQGVLWKIKDDNFERYRCHVGHAFSRDGLVDAYEQSTETALWAALRALEEKEKLAHNVAEKAREMKSENEKYFAQKAEEARRYVDTIRGLLLNK